jgi:acetyl-CoA carboxylase biotin carboxyl carrier protein
MFEEEKAQITGVVFHVVTKAGDRVLAGDPILVLESMKMEIPVEAPQAGIVVEIKVQEGETVQEGDTIALLDSRGAP